MSERNASAGEPVASTLQLPAGDWPSLLDGLCAHFPRIDRDTWIGRFARGKVQDAHRQPLAAHAAWRTGTTIHYFREVLEEPAIPLEETIIHVDEHLVVADKPHFLPVVPAGSYVRETLLARLVARLDNPALVPLHRLDRATAGLVLFSANPATRNAYQALFRDRRIHKRYEAVAPALADCQLPLERESRIVRGSPFFRMCEQAGVPNARTWVERLGGEGEWWRYALSPISGRKHQLRVHMAALGAPIRNDPWYPELATAAADDYARPLQLLAQALAFVDPITGSERRFESLRCLQSLG